MISIGGYFHGPELKDSSINKAMMAVSKALKQGRGVLGTTPWVNAVFVVPGSLGNVEFDHLTYGDYSKKTCAVVVQIPVPRSVVDSDEVASKAFVIDALHGANAMAFEFFRQKKGDPFPLREAEVLVSSLADLIKQVK